jgi:manganese/zinc/iron transport system substrate-binding protein
MKMRFLTSFALSMVVLLSACSTNDQVVDDGRIRVVGTIGQIGNAAEIIGGEHVSVNALMGAGVDPHLYVATESDVSLLSEADIIFYNGLFLEAQMDDVLKQLGQRKTAIPIGEQIDPALLLASPIYEDEHDPHIWFDLELWSIAVAAIRDTYIEFDPANAADYEANAAAYLAEIAELHEIVHEQAARLSADQRVLVTAHDAFSYFGRAYGFEVLGLQGISTQSEASTADVRNLASIIVEREVPAVFIESSVPVRNVEALQEAVAAQGFEVVIGGELFSDAMGSPGTPEGTYLGMVRHNIETIVSALLGE